MSPSTELATMRGNFRTASMSAWGGPITRSKCLVFAWNWAKSRECCKRARVWCRLWRLAGLLVKARPKALWHLLMAPELTRRRCRTRVKRYFQTTWSEQDYSVGRHATERQRQSRPGRAQDTAGERRNQGMAKKRCLS